MAEMEVTAIPEHPHPNVLGLNAGLNADLQSNRSNLTINVLLLAEASPELLPTRTPAEQYVRCFLITTAQKKRLLLRHNRKSPSRHRDAARLNMAAATPIAAVKHNVLTVPCLTAQVMPRCSVTVLC